MGFTESVNTRLLTIECMLQQLCARCGTSQQHYDDAGYNSQWTPTGDADAKFELVLHELIDHPTNNMDISACKKDEEWQLATNLMQFHQLGSTRAQAKVERDITSCNAAISACEKGEEWQSATNQHVSTRAHATVEKDTISGNAAISACEEGEDWQFATNAIRARKMGKSATQQAFDDHFPEVAQATVERDTTSCYAAREMDTISCNAKEKAIAKVKRASEKGLVSTRAQAKVEKDTTSCNAAISARKKDEEWQPATNLKQFQQLDSTRAQATVERDNTSCNAAISANEKDEEWQSATNQHASTRAQCFKVGMDTTSCNAAFRAVCKGEEWQSATNQLDSTMAQAKVERDTTSCNDAVSDSILALLTDNKDVLIFKKALGMKTLTQIRGLADTAAWFASMGKHEAAREAYVLHMRLRSDDMGSRSLIGDEDFQKLAAKWT
jgi:microcompartment protein CcmL/EutN